MYTRDGVCSARNVVEGLQSAHKINEQRDFQFSSMSTRCFIIFVSLSVYVRRRTYMNIFEPSKLDMIIIICDVFFV